jgi:hypothetical protein
MNESYEKVAEDILEQFRHSEGYIGNEYEIGFENGVYALLQALVIRRDHAKRNQSGEMLPEA